MKKISREDALEYHSQGRKGKIQVAPTKPTATQLDLSLPDSPGVAYPCKEIEKDPLLACQYTAKGNLVEVISNGTAPRAPETRRRHPRRCSQVNAAPLLIRSCRAPIGAVCVTI